ncbi:glycosyltransferase [Paenibacillus guangzhouensis]|uniref:glycosyltransferase n=1 Tax=Paenibacillus guangzhouensis TaxID=1473112 RepID=UPI001266F0C5|nr:glycosyltransferase [Paenibacillus guangzhouensis]
MKKVIIISDYIEGQPVVASVRFAGLMRYFREHYELVCLSDRKYAVSASKYAGVNYTYQTAESMFTQTMNGAVKPKKSWWRARTEQLLRQKWVISSWRNYKYSQHKFNQLNQDLFEQLDDMLRSMEVAAVFVTIPEVYGLYILDYIKRKRPDIPAIIEIRDIINHNIGGGQPRLTYRRAEQKLAALADGVVAVSQGILDYYQQDYRHLDIRLIRNGYDENYFSACAYRPIEPSVEHLTFAHIGSIYKGRNIRAFIEGLKCFQHQTGIQITLQIVGLLDDQAAEDIHSVELSGSGLTIDIVGSVAHEKAVELLKRSDIAVILTHVQGSDYAIPGKTFEYIAACKPIIAVTEDRELIQLVQDHYGECVPHRKEEIAEGLARIMQREYDFSERSRFSRQSQAMQMMAFMDKKINTLTK